MTKHILQTTPIENIEAEQTRLKELTASILAEAKRQGATAAEVGTSQGNGFSINIRMGEIDTLEYHRDKSVGITVYFDQRKGSASTSDTTIAAIKETVAAACNIARFTAEDPYAGLADAALMAYGYPELDLYHPWNISAEEGIQLAKECEQLALAEDKRITNSEGASLSTYQGVSAYGNSHGFIGACASSRHSLSCVLIGQQTGSMQRDYDYTTARDPLDLDPINKVAHGAVQRTVRRLGARRIKTQQVPVIFAAEIAGGLIGNFLAAISGGNLYRQSSFLLDHLGKQIFPQHIRIYEEPHIKKALGSYPYDNEGVMTKASDIVTHGVLQRYILSSYSARKLGMQTTGNAGGVHNLFISTGDKDLAALLQHMDTGLLVTELMGEGVNIINGDYSRGAAGFWVEKGVIQYPVEEITIAGNLRDMFANLVMVGNDVDKRGKILTGSILLERMMVAGSN